MTGNLDTQNRAGKVDLNKGSTETVTRLQPDTSFTCNYRILDMPLFTIQNYPYIIPNKHELGICSLILIHVFLQYMFCNDDRKKCVPTYSSNGTQNISVLCLPSSPPWGRNGFWFLLFRYKAKALALMQIKILAPVLTLLQLVPHNLPAQGTGTDASRYTLKGTGYRLKSGRFGPERTRFKISTSKMAFWMPVCII